MTLISDQHSPFSLVLVKSLKVIVVVEDFTGGTLAVAPSARENDSGEEMVKCQMYDSEFEHMQ